MRGHRVILGLIALGTTVVATMASAATAPRRATTGTSRPAAVHAVLPWIEDDLTRAMADAKARKTPIFVESWAPW